MKLEFKFSLINFIAFVLLGGLFYWLCPLPSLALWRWVVCVLVGVVIFGMCFVVVSHRSIIRSAPAQATVERPKHKGKK